MTLVRYWIRFGEQKGILELPSAFIALGCGITAHDIQDAKKIIQETVFPSKPLPPITDITENIKIADLERNHVLPNIGNPGIRGIWFPLSYGQFLPWWKLPKSGAESLAATDLNELRILDKISKNIGLSKNQPEC